MNLLRNRLLTALYVSMLCIFAGCGGGGGGGAAAVSGPQCPAGVTPPAGLNPDIVVSALNGNDATTTGSCFAPYRTINAAMAAATYGDTIWVAPGRYDAALGEVFPLRVPTGVTLVGDVANKGMGATQTIIYGCGPVRIGSQANISVSGDARISGFVFGHNWTVMGFGVYVEDSSGNASTVSYNTFSNTIYGGVALAGQGKTFVENNTFNSSSYGVTDSSPAATIQDNLFMGPALEIDTANGNPLIRRNEFRTGSQVGIQVQSGSPRIESNTFVSAGYPTYGAINFADGAGFVRGNSFVLGAGPAVKIRSFNTNLPDLGSVSDPGLNTFGGTSTVSVVHEANTTVNAVGNTWHTSPPVCGTEILTSGTGVVFWGPGAGNQCP